MNKTLKAHREKILLMREKSLLPATQPYVIVEIEKNKLKKQVTEINVQKQRLMAQMYQLDSQIDTLNRRIWNMRVQEPGQVGAASNSSDIIEIKKFVRKCPMNECRGFLSTQWKCGVCETKICNKCNEQRGDEHTCLPSNVASMELLNKDTKPCPECGTMIFRISGCPQMFCTDCHCAWNWNTGKVEKGVIHNPHYYEFIRKGGQVNREQGDIPCGGLPDVYTINRLTLISEKKTILHNIHRLINHLTHHELRNLQDIDNEQIINTRNRGLRVKYLMNEITEDIFKKTLQQQEKQRSKKIEFSNIYQMFVNVASDILRQIVINPTSINEQMIILENLRQYFNENLKKIAKSFNVVYPGISEKTFTFVNNMETLLK